MATIVFSVEKRRRRLWTTGVVSCDLRDVRVFDCDRSRCELAHDRSQYAYAVHYRRSLPVLNDCDVLLVERQPPGGMVAMQTALECLFGDAVVLVSSNSVTAGFRYPRGADAATRRELRKIVSVRRARGPLARFGVNIDDFSRAHDVADAYNQYAYWLRKTNDECYGKSKYFLRRHQPRYERRRLVISSTSIVKQPPVLSGQETVDLQPSEQIETGGAASSVLLRRSHELGNDDDVESADDRVYDRTFGEGEGLRTGGDRRFRRGESVEDDEREKKKKRYRLENDDASTDYVHICARHKKASS